MVAKEKNLIGHLRQLGALQTDTCINYQTLYQPHHGEHIAWGDTGTVIYANSELGISMLHRLAADPLSVLNTGDRLRIDPAHGTLQLLTPPA